MIEPRVGAWPPELYDLRKTMRARRRASLRSIATMIAAAAIALCANVAMTAVLIEMHRPLWPVSGFCAIACVLALATDIRALRAARRKFDDLEAVYAEIVL